MVGDEYIFVTRPTHNYEALNVFAPGIGNIALPTEEIRKAKVAVWRSALDDASGPSLATTVAEDAPWILSPTVEDLDASPPSSSPVPTPKGENCGTRYIYLIFAPMLLHP